MLPLDLIHNLDTIAAEGWEYHKLPLEEELSLLNSNQLNWDLPPKRVSASAPLKSARGKSIRLKQKRVNSILFH